jgi:NADH-quinone oxidoreductase subunit L
MSLIVLAVVAVGVAIAWLLVGKRPVPREAPTDVSVFTRAARADLYGDAFNDEVIIRPGEAGIRGLAVLDRTVVDGAAEGTAAAFGGMSGRFRLAQNGFVRSYALAVLLGAALILLALLAVNWS